MQERKKNSYPTHIDPNQKNRISQSLPFERRFYKHSENDLYTLGFVKKNVQRHISLLMQRMSHAYT